MQTQTTRIEAIEIFFIPKQSDKSGGIVGQKLYLSLNSMKNTFWNRYHTVFQWITISFIGRNVTS